MTREDIIRMAREAGFERDEMNTHWAVNSDEIERFAALVATAEREACAKVCDDMMHQYWNTADNEGPDPADCAEVIRARGQA